MKLLFFIHAIKGGGAERVASLLANRFVDDGYDIVLATNTQIPFSFDINPSIKLRNIVEGCPPKDSVINKVKYYFISKSNYRRIAKIEKPDITISFNVDMNCDVVLSLLGVKTPIICCEHTNLSRRLTKRTMIRRKLIYPLASCVTVLTHYDYKKFRTKMKSLVRMPNPCITEDFKEQERNNVVLAAGRINQWKIKGFDLLISSWSQLCNQHPDWKLCIAGSSDDENMASLQSIIDKNGAKNIEFLGFRNDLDKLMQSSKVFCLSSRTEGLPMVLIEAMQYGCCCVAFDCMTGPREIIKDGVSGLLAKDKDVESLTQCLGAVMENDEYREKLANNTSQSINKYSIDAVIRRWKILFDKLS